MDPAQLAALQGQMDPQQFAAYQQQLMAQQQAHHHMLGADMQQYQQVRERVLRAGRERVGRERVGREVECGGRGAHWHAAHEVQGCGTSFAHSLV